jgi:hypothetical protein
MCMSAHYDTTKKIRPTSGGPKLLFTETLSNSIRRQKPFDVRQVKTWWSYSKYMKKVKQSLPSLFNSSLWCIIPVWKLLIPYIHYTNYIRHKAKFLRGDKFEISHMQSNLRKKFEQNFLSATYYAVLFLFFTTAGSPTTLIHLWSIQITQ